MLSTWQKEEWILKQLAPGQTVHHVHRAVRLQGPLEPIAFQEKVDAIVQRYDALRTVFYLEENQPAQRVEPHAQVKMTLVELQQLPLAERESEVQRTLTLWVRRPFDNLQEPLVRVVLVQVALDQHVLLLVAHPVVANEGFLDTMVTELLGKESRGAAAISSGEAGIEYWKQQLHGSELFLGLTLDRSRPARQAVQTTMHSFLLSPEQTELLKQWCAAADVTLEHALLSVYAVLLARYTRQKDLLIGTQMAGQMLPLRFDLQELPTPSLLAQQVRDRALSAQDHVVVLEELVQAMGIDRDPSYHPLVQVAFAFEGAGEVESVWVEKATSPFDLKFQVQESADGISCAFIYSEDLFDRSTIERMAGNWQTLLTGLLQGANAEQSVFHLPILTQGEIEFLERWNNATGDYPLDKLLHELFEEQVDRTPDAIAAIYRERQLTFRELDERANQLAHYLQKRGVGPERMVGFFMERSLETLVALLAILKAGGAYVPLDPTYPMERILIMLEDTEIPILLTNEDLVDRLPELEAEVLCMDRDWEIVAQESTERVPSDVTADNLAYVIFTSGSTGRPKGVMIEHSGIANRIMYFKETFPLTTEDRMLLKTPLAFDVSVIELFWALASGAALVVATTEEVLDTAYIVELIQKEKVTTMYYVPSMLQVLLEEPDFGNCSSLKLVISSGEPLSLDLKNRYYARLPEVQLLNQYGPTETTVEITSYPMENGNTLSYIPMGLPLENTKTYVLDEWKQPVPVGVPGELYLGGIGVSRGYLKRPEQTAAVFLSDPFSDTPGARMYKSGDLVQWMPAGHLRYISRIDFQVKVRGLRIELGEIEYQLLQYEGIREAVAIVREDVPGRKQIVAYLIQEDPQAELDLWELRRYLKDRIPEYMVPAAFMVMEAFPLTPSGKTDRKQLPKPELDQQLYTAPTNELEQTLADIWADVLRLERVSIHDNFFAMGGDSIQSIQVVSRVSRLGVKIHTEELLKHQTIAELGAHIQAKKAQQGELSEALLRELPYWTQEGRQQVTLLAADEALVADDLQSLEVVVAGELLKKLQNEVLKSYRMQTSEVLLTALLRALQPDEGRHYFVIDVEGEAIPSATHPTAYPVLFDFDGQLSVTEQLQAVKEQSRQVPDQGRGYAHLRYSSDAAVVKQLSDLPQAQVWFLHTEGNEAGEAGAADPIEMRDYLIRVDSQLMDDELSVLFEVGPAHEEVADRFAKELHQLIEQGARQQAQAFTPSDFAAAKLDASQLNQFLSMISKSNGGQK